MNAAGTASSRVRGAWRRRRDCVEVAAAPVASQTSELLDRRDKYIADATLGSNEGRRGCVDLELASQPQHLHVDTAIKDIFVDAGRVQQIFAAERSLRRVENRNQQGLFALGQRHPNPIGIG